MPGASQESQAAEQIELVEPDDPAWRAFVADHPGATCFHQPAWLDTLGSAYGFPAHVAVERNTGGGITAGIPLMEVRSPLGTRRWVGLPFSDECPPLLAPGGSTATLFHQVDALRRARGVGDLEVRTGLDLAGARSRQVGVTHTLALQVSGNEGRPPRPKASVRRHIATATRLGVQVHVGEAVGDLIDTYFRLHVQTRRRQGVPAQPRRYFRLLWERMIEPGHGFVLIARHGGSPVAGAVYLSGGRTLTYKYGASDSRAWSLRPNNAIMAQAIARATEQGFTTFDFGRTELDNPGLIQFKDSWGARARPLCYTSFSDRAGHRGGPPLRGLIAPVIRRSPPILTRGLGELLYRYAA